MNMNNQTNYYLQNIKIEEYILVCKTCLDYATQPASDVVKLSVMFIIISGIDSCL